MRIWVDKNLPNYGILFIWDIQYCYTSNASENEPVLFYELINQQTIAFPSDLLIRAISLQ